MSDSILNRYAGRMGGSLAENRFAAATERPAEADALEEFAAFAQLRGLRERAIMLELRKTDGSITAIGYGYLERAEYCPAEGITLHVLGQKIRLKGRNLNSEARPSARLFEGITRHKVAWVREADHRESMMADEGETIIDSIDL